MVELRITVAVARVLREFVTDPSEARYGYELMQATGFPSGKLYPILARLERAGWLSKEREDVDPEQVGRPPRRLYRLSPAGAASARSELAMLTEQFMPVAPPRFRLRPESGIA
jgi:DNA-binding PadR family transcriptional regulator